MAEFSQLPGTLNITAAVGDTVSIPIRLTGLNITGYTVTADIFAVKASSSSADIVQEIDTSVATVPLSVTVTTATTGDLTIAYENFSYVSASRRWRLQLTAPSGAKRCAVSGSFSAALP
jgi:hypothetical protein